MNFFEHQAAARKKTGRLICLFCLSIVAVILALYLTVILIMGFAAEQPGRSMTVWDPGMLGITSAGALLVIVLGSAYKTAQLSSGGQAVAEMLGGQLLNRHTQDLHEKKILNIVEEMAIASGTPVPPVYIMADSTINAFAAGFTPGDAVIGVTRGCVEKLSRDELQGVIAHEFSHIFNGDMHLNIRLIGLIHGLVVISIIGYILLRLMGNSRGGKDEGKAIAVLALFGLALYIIGSVGAFFGGMIRAAVSRQREYLADSSAVQFTRNPGGIAGALKKIAGIGSRIEAPHAREASHLFFSMGVSSLFSTHPPIKDRIERILQQPVQEEIVERPGGMPQDRRMGFQSGNIIAGMGRVDQARLNHAHSALETLPPALTDALADPLGTISILYGLLVQNEKTAQWVRDNSDADFAEMILKMRDLCAGMGKEKRLMIVDIALPALKLLSKPQVDEFRAGLHKIIEADQELSLFEFALERMIAHHLDPDRRRAAEIKYRSLPQVQEEALLILSAVAHMSHHDSAPVTKAFDKGLETLGATGPIVPHDQCSYRNIDKALAALARTAPALKERIVEAILDAAGVDGRITVEEAEIVRAIAATLDAPIPPLHPNG